MIEPTREQIDAALEAAIMTGDTPLQVHDMINACLDDVDAWEGAGLGKPKIDDQYDGGVAMIRHVVTVAVRAALNVQA